MQQSPLIPCLVYLPHSYSGKGPAESCVQIIRYFEEEGIAPALYVGRSKSSVAPSIALRTAMRGLAGALPWRLINRRAKDKLDAQFRKALTQKARKGIAYFWPGDDGALVQDAKAHGWITVREMTNRTLAAAKSSLDKGFARVGEERPHHITQQLVDQENALLKQYDLIFSSNAQVDQSLLDAGVAPERILPTTFGWNADRFAGTQPRAKPEAGRPIIIGNLGTLSIGKGICDLLDAWSKVSTNAELHLAGPVDWSVEQRLKDAAAADPRIKPVGYIDNIERFFSQCDIVVLPTLDEGGPQVTYEACAANTAIVATDMAAARVLKDDSNALIVPPHSPAALAKAINLLATDAPRRDRLAAQAREDVNAFAYSRVGARRARQLREALKTLQGAAR